LARNPAYAQFIAPPQPHDVAVVVVHVTSARICDDRDKVTTWKKGDNLN
jgi:hypothetical protein